jgi:hypothetical protein
MKKTYLFFISFLVIAFTTKSQVNTFNHQFLYKLNHDSYDFNSVHQAYDKGYVFCRSSIDSANNIYHRYYELIKTNREGEVSWSRKILTGDTSRVSAYLIVNTLTKTTQNGILIGMCDFPAQAMPQTVLINVDSLGNVVWSKKYPGDGKSLISSIVPTSDNGYLVYGSTINSTNVKRAYLFKIDANGNQQWGKKMIIQGDIDAGFNSGIEIQGEGYLAGGYSGSKAIAVKLDYNGNIIWNKSMFTYYGKFYNIAAGNDGSYVFSGSYSDSVNTSQARLCFVKFDNSGNVIWQKGYQNISSIPYYESVGWSILPGTSNDFMFAAYVMNPIPCVVLGNLDASGNIIWSRQYRSTFHIFSQDPCNLAKTSDGGFVMNTFAGTITNGKSTFSSELLKVDANGSVGCEGMSYSISLKNLNYTTSTSIDTLNCLGTSSYSPVVIHAIPHDTTLCKNIQDPNILGVREHENNYFTVLQNYPNPSNGITQIDYRLENDISEAFLEIYDSKGNVVYKKILTDKFKGTHSVQLNLELAKGIYFYSFVMDGVRKSKFMLIE